MATRVSTVERFTVANIVAAKLELVVAAALAGIGVGILAAMPQLEQGRSALALVSAGWVGVTALVIFLTATNEKMRSRKVTRALYIFSVSSIITTMLFSFTDLSWVLHVNIESILNIASISISAIGLFVLVASVVINWFISLKLRSEVTAEVYKSTREGSRDEMVRRAIAKKLSTNYMHSALFGAAALVVSLSYILAT